MKVLTNHEQVWGGMWGGMCPVAPLVFVPVFGTALCYAAWQFITNQAATEEGTNKSIIAGTILSVGAVSIWYAYQ